MQKAKSRLSSKIVENVVASKYTTSFSPVAPPIDKKTTDALPKNDLSRLKKHLVKIHLLVIGVLGWLTVYKIVSSFYPENIKNVIIPNLYLPLTLSVFVALFFSINFLLLNSKKSLIIASAATVCFYFRLINVIFTPSLIVLILFVLFFSFFFSFGLKGPTKQWYNLTTLINWSRFNRSIILQLF